MLNTATMRNHFITTRMVIVNCFLYKLGSFSLQWMAVNEYKNWLLKVLKIMLSTQEWTCQQQVLNGRGALGAHLPVELLTADEFWERGSNCPQTCIHQAPRFYLWLILICLESKKREQTNLFLEGWVWKEQVLSK